MQNRERIEGLGGERCAGENGAPGEIRTPDLMVRSHALYPTELRAHRPHRVGRDHLAAAPQTAGARILARLPPQAN